VGMVVRAAAPKDFASLREIERVRGPARAGVSSESHPMD
jgi:hypothetical protein